MSNKVTVYSSAKPENGQTERTSENFSTSVLGKGNQIFIRAYYDYDTEHQTEADSLFFSIQKDKKGLDSLIEGGIGFGTGMINSETENLYIALPRTDDKSKVCSGFTVEIISDTVIKSEPQPQKREKHRSSNNVSLKSLNTSAVVAKVYYDYGSNKQVEVPAGEITFDIKRDENSAIDDTIYAGATNGTLISYSGICDMDLYIANPKGAKRDFYVKFVRFS